MDPLWKTALLQQFGASIDMLENALLACPSTHWQGRLWSDHSDHPLPPEYAAFWSITHHTLFWLDFCFKMKVLLEYEHLSSSGPHSSSPDS